jgi:hypothetical protein
MVNTFLNLLPSVPRVVCMMDRMDERLRNYKKKASRGSFYKNSNSILFRDIGYFEFDNP